MNELGIGGSGPRAKARTAAVATARATAKARAVAVSVVQGLEGERVGVVGPPVGVGRRLDVRLAPRVESFK